MALKNGRAAPEVSFATVSRALSVLHDSPAVYDDVSVLVQGELRHRLKQTTKRLMSEYSDEQWQGQMGLEYIRLCSRSSPSWLMFNDAAGGTESTFSVQTQDSLCVHRVLALETA